MTPPTADTGHGPGPGNLTESVAARWRRRLAHGTKRRQRHWYTKISYYEAAARLVVRPTSGPPAWRDIVAAVRPAGSPSTYYEVTGPNATYSLYDAYVDDGGLVALQVALCCRRSVAAEQLLDEVKVWTFWPYRAAWLDRGHHNGDRLAAAVLEWAGRCAPRLAWLLQHPASAPTGLRTRKAGPPAASVGAVS